MSVKPIKGPFTYDFARPSVTATMVLFNNEPSKNIDDLRDGVSVIFGRRKKTTGAYPGYLCLPGGFLDTGIDASGQHFGERIEQTAVRETFEETSILLDENNFRLLCVKSDPETDPRCHVINICFLGWLPDNYAEIMKASDDLEALEVHWFAFNQTDEELHAQIRDLKLAFNHAEILLEGILALEGNQ